MWIGVKNPAKTSTLTVDSDLDLGAYKLKSNHISESTGAHGVALDHALTVGTANVTTGNITTIAATTVAASSRVTTPEVREASAAGGVKLSGVAVNTTCSLSASDTELKTASIVANLNPASSYVGEANKGLVTTSAVTIPARYYPAGSTVRVKVNGETYGSSEWNIGVFINGVRQGSSSAHTGVFTATFSTVTVSPGDSLTVYAWATGSSAFQCAFSYVKVYGTESQTTSYTNSGTAW